MLEYWFEDWGIQLNIGRIELTFKRNQEISELD